MLQSNQIFNYVHNLQTWVIPLTSVRLFACIKLGVRCGFCWIMPYNFYIYCMRVAEWTHQQESILLVSVRTWGQIPPFSPKGFTLSVRKQRVGQEIGLRGSRAACSFAPTAAEDWCEESCVHVRAHFGRSHASSVKECDDRAGRYLQKNADMVKNCPSWGR